MDAAELIRKAKAEGRTALTEAESKEVLRQFGVPVVAESVAATPEEAVGKGAGDRISRRPEGPRDKADAQDGAGARPSESQG